MRVKIAAAFYPIDALYGAASSGFFGPKTGAFRMTNVECLYLDNT